MNGYGEAMERIPLGDNAVTLQAILEADREARAFVRFPDITRSLQDVFPGYRGKHKKGSMEIEEFTGNLHSFQDAEIQVVLY